MSTPRKHIPAKHRVERVSLDDLQVTLDNMEQDGFRVRFVTQWGDTYTVVGVREAKDERRF